MKKKLQLFKMCLLLCFEALGAFFSFVYMFLISAALPIIMYIIVFDNITLSKILLLPAVLWWAVNFYILFERGNNSISDYCERMYIATKKTYEEIRYIKSHK